MQIATFVEMRMIVCDPATPGRVKYGGLNDPRHVCSRNFQEPSAYPQRSPNIQDFRRWARTYWPINWEEASWKRKL
jgi:hypothetical protein